MLVFLGCCCMAVEAYSSICLDFLPARIHIKGAVDADEEENMLWILKEPAESHFGMSDYFLESSLG